MSGLDGLLISIWQEILGQSEVNQTTGFIEAGGTSLSAEKIASRVRAAIKISVSGADIIRAETIGGLVQLILKRSNAQQA
jgi:Phosphopantetheine attachment site